MNYFELLKAKHGLPVSDAYTALLGKKLQGGGYPVTEIFGQLPFSFLSRGASIPEWTLYGKTVQNGTPTPTSPIPVQGVGDLVESGEYAGKYAVEISNNGNTVATLYTDKPLYGTGTNLDYLQRLTDGSGVEHREWNELVLDGTEAWYDTTEGMHRLTLEGYLRESINTPFCTHYKGISPVDSYTSIGDLQTAFLISSSGNNYFYVRDDSFTTASQFKSYLAEQYAAGTPVTVWYVLATPTDTTVTLPEIPTAVGTNTLDTDTTVHGDARIKGRIEEV